MKDLSVDNLTTIKDLTKSDIELIFNTADNFKKILNQPIKKVPSLRDLKSLKFCLIENESNKACVGCS